MGCRVSIPPPLFSTPFALCGPIIFPVWPGISHRGWTEYDRSQTSMLFCSGQQGEAAHFLAFCLGFARRRLVARAGYLALASLSRRHEQPTSSSTPHSPSSCPPLFFSPFPAKPWVGMCNGSSQLFNIVDYLLARDRIALPPPLP